MFIKKLQHSLIFTLLWLFMLPVNAKDWLDEQGAQWNVVNDGVMGGLSQSRAFRVNDENSIRFEGNLSLENNGGFASIRSVVDTDSFNGTNKICAELKGDGRVYQFRLRDSSRFDGAAYVAEFKTKKDIWQEYCFTPEHFTPQFRGRKLSKMPVISFSDIRQVSFLLADQKLTRFRLDIRSIKAKP
jgi:NADH dehydrogenase [ubiquinone] 1 alpha subcomplex assembly factor 1